IADQAGNAGSGSTDSNNYAIDTQAPDTPNAPDLESGSDSGVSDTDNITNVLTPTFSGVAEAGSTISVTSDLDGALGSATANGTGEWSFTPGGNLSSGVHAITVTETDLAGNSSSESAALILVIDTSAPTADILANQDLILDSDGNATLDPNDIIISLADDNSSVNNITLELSKGSFGCSDVGNNSINLTTVDQAGNSSNWMSTINVKDNTGPEVRGKDITVNVDAFGSYILFSTMIDDGSSDACGISGYSVSPAIFTRDNEGVNDVTFTVTDINGNSNSVTVQVTVVVNPKILDVVVDEGQGKVFGEDDPEFTFEATGFEGGDDESILTGALEREIGEDVGTYEISMGTLDAGPNYTINLIEADFEITPATLTVTADADQNKIYGDVDPTFTYGVSGFENGDDESILTGSLSRVEGEDVGTYTITEGDLSAGDNYTIDYTGANFEITERTLSVVASLNQGKVYGEADPTLTYTASNFGNGDDESILSGTLSRQPGEDIGTYAISLGSLDAGDNYTIDYTGADFEITEKTLTITVTPGQSKTYGDTDPTFAYVATGFGPGDDESILTGELERESGEDVGGYAINLGSLSAGANYTIDFAGADFVITPATLTVTADANQSKTYGDVDPTFSYQATDFKNGDGESILTGELERESGEDVGTYGILQGSLSAGDNYTIDYTGADFAITPATLNITA
ncbi:MBG domain-containing protein, partial [Algoriphagus sp.]|uniref:MBG domain-containing protein n=1 Tax=Algoriphagus sp. TaxID=1872435 RepID=UPI002638A26E